MNLLDKKAVKYQIVLKKIDKIKKNEINKVQTKTTALIAKRPAAYPKIILTSSEKKSGLDELRSTIASIAIP